MDIMQESNGIDTQKRFLSANKLKPNKNIKLKYGEQFDSYENKRLNGNFNNGSGGISGVFQTSVNTRTPSKQEQSAILEHKMNKIDHILDNSYTLY